VPARATQYRRPACHPQRLTATRMLNWSAASLAAPIPLTERNPGPTTVWPVIIRRVRYRMP